MRNISNGGVPVTLIVDSSYIYALTNPRDFDHPRAAAFAKNVREEIWVPNVVLPEVAYLFQRDFGKASLPYFLKRFQEFDSALIALERSDLDRISEIAEFYASAAFDIVDCCIMALAERLGITRIATFDRRDFSIFRPRHCEFLELLPAQR